MVLKNHVNIRKDSIKLVHAPIFLILTDNRWNMVTASSSLTSSLTQTMNAWSRFISVPKSVETHPISHYSKQTLNWPITIVSTLTLTYLVQMHTSSLPDLSSSSLLKCVWSTQPSIAQKTWQLWKMTTIQLWWQWRHYTLQAMQAEPRSQFR